MSNFQELAYELMRVKPYGPNVATEVHIMWQTCVNAVADACAQSNEQFDRGRFQEACDAGKYVPAMHGR